MKQIAIITVLKTLMFLVLTTVFYYFLILKPQVTKRQELSESQKIINQYLAVLVQNRIAYVGLTQLDENSQNISLQTSSLISTLRRTKIEYDELDDIGEIVGVGSAYDIDFAELNKEMDLILKDQEHLLSEVVSTDTYNDGVVKLKSKESVDLLVRLTNVINKLQYLGNKIR